MTSLHLGGQSNWFRTNVGSCLALLVSSLTNLLSSSWNLGVCSWMCLPFNTSKMARICIWKCLPSGPQAYYNYCPCFHNIAVPLVQNRQPVNFRARQFPKQISRIKRISPNPIHPNIHPNVEHNKTVVGHQQCRRMSKVRLRLQLRTSPTPA